MAGSVLESSFGFLINICAKPNICASISATSPSCEPLYVMLFPFSVKIYFVFITHFVQVVIIFFSTSIKMVFDLTHYFVIPPSNWFSKFCFYFTPSHLLLVFSIRFQVLLSFAFLRYTLQYFSGIKHRPLLGIVYSSAYGLYSIGFQF